MLINFDCLTKETKKNESKDGAFGFLKSVSGSYMRVSVSRRINKRERVYRLSNELVFFKLTINQYANDHFVQKKDEAWTSITIHDPLLLL